VPSHRCAGAPIDLQAKHLTNPSDLSASATATFKDNRSTVAQLLAIDAGALRGDDEVRAVLSGMLRSHQAFAKHHDGD
jgi:hypothetical protein